MDGDVGIDASSAGEIREWIVRVGVLERKHKVNAEPLKNTMKLNWKARFEANWHIYRTFIHYLW